MKIINLLKSVLIIIIFCFVVPINSNASITNILSITIPTGVSNYNEVYLQSIGSTLYVNTELTGKVVVAREIKADQSLGKKYYFDFIQISDNWAEMVFDNPILRFNEIILLGTRGNVLLKKSPPGHNILIYKNGTSSGSLVSKLGDVNGTIYFPDSQLLDIDSLSVGVQKPDGEKVKGTVIVANDRTIAFRLKNINSSYVNNGKSKLVIRLRSKTILVDLDSWGYTFDIERIEPNKNNLLSSVFGLEPSRQLNINYEAYEGQVIEPYSNTFTVGEINQGKPLASIQDDNKPIKFELLLAN